MHKVDELEQRWFNYKVKKLISPLMRLSVFSLVISGAYYAYENKENFLSPLPVSNKMTNVLGVSMEVNDSKVEPMPSLIKVKEPQVETAKQDILQKEVIKKPEILESIALTPVIPVIDMEKEERVSAVKRVKTKQSNMVIAKKNKYLTAKELAVINKSKSRVEPVARKTKKMKFTSTSTNYLETMKEKFSKSKSPRDALLVAKTYYKNAEYVESEKWSLTANKLNNSLEESWLLFAKSKAKLGKTKEALKILVSYHKKSHSVKAKRLIGKIRTGQI